MLDYEWGNPSPMMLANDDPAQDSEQTRQIFDHYHQNFTDNHLLPPPTAYSHHHFHHQPPHNPHHHSFYDPRAYGGAYTHAPSGILSLEPVGGSVGAGFMVIPKAEEEVCRAGVDFTARIGLNLGGRTYFSSAEDDYVNRIYRRTRPSEPGSVNSPRCQAEGCNADLSNSKHYHRRHKVCEFHSKASTVVAGGLTQRFCQQCSRFHLLSEFDNGKRSCRKRLADHNRRRRKSQQTSQENQKSPQPENPRSPPDSGAQSPSSVTMAASPPRMSLDYFRERPYQATASSASSSSLFFSSG